MTRAARGTLAILLTAVLPAVTARGPAAGPPRRQEAVRVRVTTGDRSRLLERQPDLAFTDAAAGAGPVIEVDERRAFQEMVGFGASLTDASAWLIHHRMTAGQRRALVADLFGRESGIGLDFVRLTMGASDFSLDHYTYDDAPPGHRDPELRRFSIDADRDAVIPVVKQAMEVNPDLTVMASPWSAPAWMKTGGSLVGGRLRPDAYAPYAAYFRRFIKAYAAEGVPIWAVTVQNEPHHEPADYPGMRMDAAERARFIGGHLGPLLERAGFETRILEWDHNWDEPGSPLEVLADPAARAHIDGVAWHCYAGDVSAQRLVREAHPDLDQFLTECSGGGWAPDFGDNLLWVTRTLLIGGTRNGARGVLLWNLALDREHGPHTGGCADCRGVVTIDRDTGRYTRNEEYYALAHVSRSVRRGARRIESTAATDGLESVAFRNPDGSKVLIVVNPTDDARPFGIRWRGRVARHTLPPRAVATYCWS